MRRFTLLYIYRAVAGPKSAVLCLFYHNEILQSTLSHLSLLQYLHAPVRNVALTASGTDVLPPTLAHDIIIQKTLPTPLFPTCSEMQ